MTIIDYASDLHLEINSQLKINYPKNDGDICILAGDIIPFRFLGEHRTDASTRSIQKSFKRLLNNLDHKIIVFIPGNHEYYGYHLNADFDRVNEDLRRFDSRLVSSPVGTIEYNNIKLIYSTLWTDYNNNDPVSKIVAHDSMNDYRQIRKYEDNASKITPDDLYEKNQSYLKYIQTACDDTTAKRTFAMKTIVATHTAPSLKSHGTEKYGDTFLKYAYCSDLDNFIASSNIHTWIHGHTHYDVDYEIGDTRITSSMYGYDLFSDKRTSKFEFGRLIIE